jgi:hypothetical protein
MTKSCTSRVQRLACRCGDLRVKQNSPCGPITGVMTRNNIYANQMRSLKGCLAYGDIDWLKCRSPTQSGIAGSPSVRAACRFTANCDSQHHHEVPEWLTVYVLFSAIRIHCLRWWLVRKRHTQHFVQRESKADASQVSSITSSDSSSQVTGSLIAKKSIISANQKCSGLRSRRIL